MPRLVLASSSPFRQRILAEAGLHATTRPPGIDESVFLQEDPCERALAIAHAKSTAVRLADDEIGIAADQVVFDPDRGCIFGKPADAAEHTRRLIDLRGRVHELVTGWVVWSPRWSEAGVEVTRVRVRADLTEAEIRAYVQSGEASGCAGGYAAEAAGSFLIEHVDTDSFNVIGLPLYTIHSALRKHGWRYGDAG